MTEAIAVLNAGSSSIKFSVFAIEDDRLQPMVHGQVEGIFTAPRFIARDATGVQVAGKSWGDGVRIGHDEAQEHLMAFVRQHFAGHRLVGVGHRVVHGGLEFTRPVRVDAQVLAALERFVPLAPLHQPHNLAPIRRLLESEPQLPQVACFDTAFHRGSPELSQLYALPAELQALGIRRYGFHGLSYEYIAALLPGVDPRAADGRTIVLHLGNGASMCALLGGRSIASTMGFTAVEGLPMGTRSGSLDPGVILYLIEQRGMDARAVEHLLYHESGLLGVSGVSSDMRTLLASADPRARLAIDLYVYRIGRELGSLAAALGGLDAIVFTAGIGENSDVIRARICGEARWLGVRLDPTANAAGGPRISPRDAAVQAWCLPTDEERMIALHTRRLLATGDHRH